MTCADFEGSIVEMARGAASSEAERHAQECPGCLERLRRETQLTAGFEDLRLDQALERPSKFVHAALVGELKKPQRSLFGPWAWPAAAAILLGLAAGVLTPSPEPVPAPPVRASNPFVLLDFSRPITPTDVGRMVRVSLPGSAPAMLGLPAAGARRVEADILLGEDGSARAIRFIDYNDF